MKANELWCDWARKKCHPDLEKDPVEQHAERDLVVEKELK